MRMVTGMNGVGVAPERLVLEGAGGGGGDGGRVCAPAAAPIGLSPLLILTLFCCSGGGGGVIEERGGGGVWEPKLCVPTMAPSDLRPSVKFRFPPRWSLWCGVGWGVQEGVNPPPLLLRCTAIPIHHRRGGGSSCHFLRPRTSPASGRPTPLFGSAVLFRRSCNRFTAT